MKERAYWLKHIRFRYPGSRFELELKNMEIEAGKVIALVGPNGAGKTTLLFLLGLLQKPVEGILELFGTDPWESREQLFNKRRQVVMLTHQPYLFQKSVFDNLVFGLKVRGTPEREWESKVREALAMVEMNGFEKKSVKELSAGQAQRVALARAIILNPKVLLLDEPTANIDSNLISRIEATILEVQRGLNSTVVFTTHNFSQAFRLADEVIYLSDGRRVQYSHENYFSGRAETDGKISWIEPKAGTKIFFNGNYTGHIICLISPEQIELHSAVRADPGVCPAGRTQGCAPTNIFEGRITRLEMADDNLALARVSGDLSFRVNLPVTELHRKNISLNSQVLIKFSPEAVKIIN
jgi:tungstate transport system ATP-binding protein